MGVQSHPRHVPLRRCQASCFWRARRWQGGRARKSLCHIIYIRREPISPHPSIVQNTRSFFRRGLVSPSSIRATVLPSWEQTTVPAAEMGSSITVERRGGSHPVPGGGFPTFALRGCQRLSSLGDQGHRAMAYSHATVTRHNRDFCCWKQCGRVDTGADRSPAGLAPDTPLLRTR